MKRWTSLTKLGISFGYFIDDNKRGKISTLLTSRLFESQNGL